LKLIEKQYKYFPFLLLPDFRKSISVLGDSQASLVCLPGQTDFENEDMCGEFVE
jgi:hypothetical protein